LVLSVTSSTAHEDHTSGMASFTDRRKTWPYPANYGVPDAHGSVVVVVKIHQPSKGCVLSFTPKLDWNFDSF